MRLGDEAASHFLNVQDRAATSLHENVSASRQIATWPLDSLLASAKAISRCISLRRQRRFRSTRQARSHRTSRLSSRSVQGVRLQNKVMSFALLASEFIQNARMSWTRCCSSASGRCKLLSAVTRLIYSLLDPAVKTTESIIATCCHNHVTIKADVDPKVFCFFIYVGDAGNTSFVDAGTPLGTTAIVTPGSAGYLLWECCILASL